MNEYFSHDYRARYDDKLVSLMMIHGLAGIGAFWCIIEMCYEKNGYVERSQYERIAFELRADIKFIQSVVEDFNLFLFEEEKFYSRTALDRLDKRNQKSEKARQSVAARWSKKQNGNNLNNCNTNVSHSHNTSNTIKEKKNKEKNIKENNTPLTLSEKNKIEKPNPAKSKEKNCAKKENRNIIPPTLEMVTAYCQSRKNNVSPDKFINHYTATNWHIGKQKMCDWEAAVRTWEKNTNPHQTKEYGKL